jgi:crotonobetainyl-CoA:carnitine CoA-transferase CaiB-like acyl-CoA transferase
VGPLSGIRVLDLSAMVSGPVAAMMLADQGAEVIKLEPPGGEQMRHLGAPHNGMPPMFYSCNRGKKSIVVDLKQDAGRRVLGDLIREADVLLQNFRPGAMERIGFGADTVCALYPRLIYVSISGFGERGPYAHKRVYDPVIQALSGATDIQANRETGRPAMFRIIVADKVTSVTAAQAVSAALFHRERHGAGQHIRLSMLDTMIAFFWPEGMGGLTFADNEYDPSLGQGTMDLVFQALDGYITAGAISDSEWAGMCRAFGREELIADERFRTARARGRNADERKRIMATEIAKWPRAEILARLDANDVPSAPLLMRRELMDHEQIRVNGSIERADHPGFGEVRQAIPAARFSGSPSAIAGPAPQLGEHSREILQRLGYTTQQCDALITSGVVVGPTIAV